MNSNEKLHALKCKLAWKLCTELLVPPLNIFEVPKLGADATGLYLYIFQSIQRKNHIHVCELKRNKNISTALILKRV